jgi:hypothetical protein
MADSVVVMTAGKPVDLLPPVKTAGGAYGGEASFTPTAGAPFSSAFAQRSVEETDKFVLDALTKGGDDPSPRLGGHGEGELDALAFAMGALSELANDDDVNQARARRCCARHRRTRALELRARAPPPRARAAAATRAGEGLGSAVRRARAHWGSRAVACV